MSFLNPPHFDDPFAMVADITRRGPVFEDPFALLAELHLHIDALETARNRAINILAEVPDDRHPL